MECQVYSCCGSKHFQKVLRLKKIPQAYPKTPKTLPEGAAGP